MASRLGPSPSTTARCGQPPRAPCTSSATVGAAGTTTCSPGRSAFSRTHRVLEGRVHALDLGGGRLPGRTSRIGSSGPAPISRRNRRRIGARRSRCARVASPTRTVFNPSRSNAGGIEGVDGEQQVEPLRPPSRARPGRDAQTWGPTYFTSGSCGSWRRRRWATRRVKPQESISTATSGFSRAARAAVSAGAAHHLAVGQQAPPAGRRSSSSEMSNGLSTPSARILAPPTPTNRTPSPSRRFSARASPAPGRRPRPRPPPA